MIRSRLLRVKGVRSEPRIGGDPARRRRVPAREYGMKAREDYVKASLIGTGLAFGLGWLWFPWLGGVWLPGFLWGGPVSGGVGAFLLLLVLGFALGGFFAARLLVAGGAGQAFLLRNGFLCHGVAYCLLLAALLLRLHGPMRLPGTWPYFALPAVVAAYAVVGLYWAARLLALPPFMSAFAFFAAAAVAALSGEIASLASLGAQIVFWPQTVLAAMALAATLSRMERPQPKGRGRPPKKEAEPAPLPLRLGDDEPGAASMPSLALLAAVLACIGFTDGAAWTLYGERIAAPPVWLGGLAFAAGALAPVFAVALLGDPVVRGLLCAAAVAAGTLCAAFAFPWRPAAGALSHHFAEAAVSGMGLCLLAGSGVEARAIVRRAGIVLAVCVAAMNGGRVAGEFAAGMAGFPLVVVPPVAVCLALLGQPARLLVREMKRRDRDGTAAGAGSPSGGFTDAPDPFAEAPANFTGEERRIMELVAREGMSNQDIADRLFITRSTVRYHLKKIYAKTNTSGRGELLDFIASLQPPDAGSRAAAKRKFPDSIE